AIVVIIKVDSVSCFGESNGTAEAIANGGTGSYSYQWSTNPLQQTQIATDLSTGIYSVTVTDANGCTANSTAQVDAPPPFTVTMDSLFEILRGESIVLATQVSEPNVTYAWSPQENLSCSDCSAPEASPIETTLYTVTATTANGCPATAVTTVVVQDIV